MTEKTRAEQLAAMTYEEMMRLPEGKLAQMMREINRQKWAKTQEFDNPEYAAYTFEQKVRYWT